MDSYLNDSYIKHNNPPHGVFSHLFQTYVQLRFLGVCGEAGSEPGRILRYMRGLPAKGEAYFESLSAPYRGDVVWSFFWRSTNDNFENMPVFANAHFVSFVLFMLTPKIAEMNFLGIEK